MAVSALVAIGCTRTSATTPRDAAPLPMLSPRVADTVFYISARARESSSDVYRFADSLEFGYVIHSRRRQADVLTDGLDIALDDSVRLSRQEFTEQLRLAALPSDAGTVDSGGNADSIAVLYVHGYSTSLHECWRNVTESRMRSRSATPWVAFCWPSNGLGIAAPRRGALLDRAYRDDSTAAVASAPAFVRSAEIVLDAVAAPRLLFVAHSMGTQLMGAALSDSTTLSARLRATPAKAIVFAAADMETTRFTDLIVPAVRPLTSRLVAYVSGRDRMLALSRQRSGESCVGLRQRTPLVHPQLESIDATDALVAENWFQDIFGTHHAVRRASSVLFDLIFVVGGSRTPACRATLGTALQSAEGVWQLLAVRPDIVAAAQRCARIPASSP